MTIIQETNAGIRFAVVRSRHQTILIADDGAYLTNDAGSVLVTDDSDDDFAPSLALAETSPLHVTVN